MEIRVVRFLIAMLVTICGSSAFAVLGPQTFTLDGRLKQAGTTSPLLDNSVHLVVEILDPSQTCVLYAENQTVNTLTSDGYFTIQVGSNTGAVKRLGGVDPGLTMGQVFSNAAAMAATDADGQTCTGGLYTPLTTHARYMRIKVTPSSSGVEDTLADVLMDSVPMATTAENALSVQGFGPAQLLRVNTTGTEVLSQTNVENIFETSNYNKLVALLAGTSVLYNKPAANGTTVLPSITTPTTPAAGQVWFDSGSIKYYDGTTTQIVSTGTSTQVSAGNGTAAAPSISFAGDTDTGWYLPLANTLAAATGGAERVRIDSSGRLGIGTTNPAYPLDIAGNASVGTTGAGGVLVFRRPDDGTAQASIGYGSAGVSTTDLAIRNVGTNGVITFATNDGSTTERMRVANDGNVGIGTTNPARLLHVNGPIRVQPAALPGTPAAGDIAIDSGATNALKWYDGTAWQSVATSGSGVTSFNTRTGAVTPATNDYTWAQVNKATSSLADLTTRSAADLSSGTLADARLSSNVVLKDQANVFSVGGQQITNSVAATKPLVIKAAASQTATLTDWQNSSGTTLYGLDATGVPTATTDLTTKSYVDTKSGNYVLKAGDTMTGTLTLPTNGLVAGTNQFVLSGGNVGIGTTNPQGFLHLVTSSGNTFYLDGYANPSKFYMRRANGSTASPTGPLDEEVIANFAGFGYGTTAFGSSASGAVKIVATENFSDTTQGGAVTFSTVTNGTIVQAERMRVDNNGNVGIGTTTPNRLLDVAGPIRIQAAALPSTPGTGDLAVDSGAGNALKWYDGSAWQTVGTSSGGVTSFNSRTGAVTPATNDYTWAQVNKATSSLADLTTRSAADLSSGTLADARLSSNVVLKDQANVFSVGGQQITNTVAATKPLVIKAAASQTATLTDWQNSSGTTLYGLDAAGTPTLTTDLTTKSYVDTKAGAYVLKAGDTMTGTLTLPSNGLVAGTTQLVLASGRVGIGTASPTVPLEVTGNAIVNGTMSVQTDLGASPSAYGATMYVSNPTSTGDVIRIGFNDGSDLKALIEAGKQSATTDGYLALKVRNTTMVEAMRIDKTGYIGIGTTAPARILHVNGPMRLQPASLPGTPGAGDLAVDSGAGNALKWYDGSAWQTVGTSSGGVTSFNSRTGAVTPATNDYTWTQVNKATSSLADLTTRSAADLSSGTLADARLSSNVVLKDQANVFSVGGQQITNTVAATKPFVIKAAASQTATLTDWQDSSGTTLYGLDAAGVPTATTDLTTKSYVDTKSGNYVLKAGDTMTGTLTVPSNGIIAGTSQFVLSGGNVGIGITNPTSPLHLARTSSNPLVPAFMISDNSAVANSTTKGQLYIKNSENSGSGHATVVIDKGNASAVAGLSLLTAGVEQWQMSINGSNNFTLIDKVNSHNVAVVMQGAPANSLYIAASGNVGLGTASPARLLHVNGPMRVQPAALPGTPAAGDIAVDSGAGNALKWYDGSAWQTVGTSSGGVTSFNTRTGAVVPGTNDYTWAQVNKATSSLADLTTRSAADLSSGTLADARLSSNVVLKDQANVFSVGGQQITNTVAATKPLVIKAAASQTATLTDWQNSSGTTLYGLDPSGVPVATTDLTTKSYVDTAVGSYVLKAGDTMTGALNLPANGLKVAAGTLAATPATGMIAFDSADANKMKYYNGSAWQTLGTGTGSGDFKADGTVPMTGAFLGYAGLVGTPGITFDGDADTGMWHPAANTLAFSTLGAERMRINSSGFVGIGSTAPGYPLTVVGQSNFSGDLTLTSGKIYTSDQLRGYSGTAQYPTFSFNGFPGYNSGMYYPAANSIGFSTAQTERVRIDGSGYVGIGTTNPSRLLDVAGPIRIQATTLPGTPLTGDLAIDSGASNALKWYNGSAWQTVGTGGGSGDFKADGSVSMTGAFKAAAGTVSAPGITFSGDTNSGIYSQSDDVLHFVTNGTEALNIDASGDLNTNNSIYANKFSNSSAGSQAYAASSGSLTYPNVYFANQSYNTSPTDSTISGTLVQVTNGSSLGQYGYYGFISNTGAAVYSPTFVLGRQTASNTYSESMRINGSGYVGIGTTAPGRLLDVAGPIRIQAASLPSTPLTGDLAIDSSASNALKWYNGSAWQTVGTGGGSGDFLKDGSVAMTGQFKALGGSAGTPGISFSGDPDTGFYNGTNLIGFTTGGTNRFYIDGTSGLYSNNIYGGSLAVGAGSATAPNFYFGVSDSGTGMFRPAASTIGFTNNGAEKMRLDSSGNLGIGTTNPTTTLHVAGAAQIINAVAATKPLVIKAAASQTAKLTEWQNSSATALYGLDASGVASATTDLVTKSYVDTSVGSYVLKAGDTMTGTLTLPSNGLVAGTNQLVISGGNVGIGTAAPQTKLHLHTASVADTAIQFTNSVTGSTANDGFFVGAADDNTSFLWNNENSDMFFATNDTARIVIQGGGNVGIGTMNPGQALEVNGSVLASAYLYSSDIRLKKDIKPIPYALDKINTLNGVTYDWRKPANVEDEVRQMGVIAQDVEKVFPEAVKTSTVDGYKRVNYPSLVAPLIEAVKELYAMITGQDKRIEELEKQNADLSSKLETLDSRLKELENRMGTSQAPKK